MLVAGAQASHRKNDKGLDGSLMASETVSPQTMEGPVRHILGSSMRELQIQGRFIQGEGSSTEEIEELKRQKRRMSIIAKSKSMREQKSIRKENEALQTEEDTRSNVELAREWPDAGVYSERSCLLMGRKNFLRQLCIKALENKWWDRGVLLFIFMNTIVLAMFDPYDTDQILPKHAPGKHLVSGKSWPPLSAITLSMLTKFFSAIFLVECIVRICAFGFIFDRLSYLRRDSSNILDFGIVIVGALDLLPTGDSTVSLGSLRLFRILRVMRTFTTFPELRSLVLVLLRSMPALGDAMLLCIFVFFMFGILGVQLYRGALHGRCFDVETGALISEELICGPGYFSDKNEDSWIRKGMQISFDVSTLSHHYIQFCQNISMHLT